LSSLDRPSLLASLTEIRSSVSMVAIVPSHALL
jgi:hypothetical protein